MAACSVCTHADHAMIDELLVNGMGNREAGRRFALHKDAVRRHRDNHLSALVQAAEQAAPPPDAGTALERLERLSVRVERVLSSAERSGNANHAIAASRELRQVTEVLAKIRGELDERTQVNVLNLATDSTWLATRAAILEALRPYPQAAAAVAARLAALEPAPEGGAPGAATTIALPSGR